MAELTARSSRVRAFERNPFPEYLPRERVVIAAPSTCPCGSAKLAKLGEKRAFLPNMKGHGRLKKPTLYLQVLLLTI